MNKTIIYYDKDKKISDIVSDGTDYILSYFTNDKKYHFHGKHKGQITGKNITFETFVTEKELLDRIDKLQIKVPDEVLWEREGTLMERLYILNIKEQMIKQLEKREIKILKELEESEIRLSESEIEDEKEKRLDIERIFLLDIESKLIENIEVEIQKKLDEKIVPIEEIPEKIVIKSK